MKDTEEFLNGCKHCEFSRITVLQAKLDMAKVTYDKNQERRKVEFLMEYASENNLVTRAEIIEKMKEGLA